ncbi:sensor histidine kinase [Mucilaginibacter flavus]|uniref:sensor histidine kinase n=1 Tax=Mucilaginibacter flavus TaxID=931504 RepID=UPI0025B2B15F|nr:histidine kinase dimerization/phosphoacceptor domain -containing protein [Mucilaginibacter flavus]MDN3582392.1 histidine kinase dimerization/phosphoacceptor domain -containing protein [Mucilaginibacter flavus]
MRIVLAIGLLLCLQVTASAQVLKTDAGAARLKLLLNASHTDSLHKNYQSAIHHFIQYRQLKDSLLNITSQGQIKKLKQLYQTAKKDNEITVREKNIDLLTGQNKLTDINLSQTRAIRTIIFIVALITALLLPIGYLSFRLKKRANARLQEQEKAINQKNEALQQLAAQKDNLLDEKELLIKEIHHRVKNNLQVVISLLNTQSAYLNDPHATSAIRQSQHRMQSISLIHQKLYQSESRALINMREYTHELIQYLRQSFDDAARIHFNIDIADIELDVLKAVPIGLILNEAISNAIKHAFPADGSGRIDIELSCAGDQQLNLSVADNGKGLSPGFNIDLCKSLGINLMTSMCRQLNGQLSVKNKNGVSIAITFAGDTSSFDELSSFDDVFSSTTLS